MKTILLAFLILSVGMQAFEQTPTTSFADLPYEKQLQQVKKICREAGVKILAIRSSESLHAKNVILPNGKIIRQTSADLDACQYILDELTKKTPNYGVISQDRMELDPQWYTKDRVWLINAIDGTKKFERGCDDFHIQIGLLDHDEPVLGVSYFPATDTYIWAIKNQGAWLEQKEIKQKLVATSCSEKVLILSSNYKILEPYFRKWEWIPDRVDFATFSSTSRLLKIIQGKASLYISLGASPLGKEKNGGVWNYGANAVIAKEAGLILTTLSGNPINLREPSGLLTEGVILTTDPTVYKVIIQTRLAD